MKYEKSFTNAELGIEPLGYLCPSIDGVVATIASRYNREVSIDKDFCEGLYTDLRNAIASAMCDGLDAFIDAHIDADSTMEIVADTIEKTDSQMFAQGFTLAGNEKPIDLSIAREIFSTFDHDELMAAIEDEFIDALIMRIKQYPRKKAETPEAVHTEPKAIDVPLPEPLDVVEDDWDDDDFDEAVEVVAEEIEEPDFHGLVPVKPEPVKHEVAEAPIEVAEQPITPSAIANLTDPEGLLTKYRANFNDICSVHEVANAQSNVMSRDGNNIVLTSTIISEPGYKLVTITKYDAKNKGKQCRTTENDGRDTHIWSWRTPSLYGWAMERINEDGSFPNEVLGAALVEKGAGSCKTWGVRFLPTPKEVRNANRGRSRDSKEVAKPIDAQPKVAQPSQGEWWRYDGEYFYIANVSATISLVAYHDAESNATDVAEKKVASAISYLKENGFITVSIEKVPDDVVIAVSDAMDRVAPSPKEVKVEVVATEPSPVKVTLDDAEARIKAAAEAAAKAEAEKIERERKEAEAKAEAERKAREEAERIERERKEAEAKAEAERERIEAERKAAEAKAAAEAERIERERKETECAKRGGLLNPHRNTTPDVKVSPETEEFLTKFSSDADFRKEILHMVRERAKDAERAKAEEEARAKKGKGRTKHPMFDKVLRRVKHGKPAYLFGKAGTGKNVLAEQIAEALGIPFAPINCLFEKFEVTGFARPDGTLQETTIYLAVKYGWLLFWDEADTSQPQAGNVMNSLLANGYIDFPVVGRVYAHPNFRCIAAGNTNGRGGDSEYTGRTILDAATLNRFRLYEIDYDREVELAIATKRGYGAEEVDFIEDFRQATAACGISHLTSYRQLDDMLDDLEDGCTTEEAISAVVRDLPKDDYPTIARQLKCGRNKYSAKFNDMARNMDYTRRAI